MDKELWIKKLLHLSKKQVRMQCEFTTKYGITLFLRYYIHCNFKGTRN